MKRIEPNIIETSYYTLVSANEGVGKTFWCKRQIAKTLRTIYKQYDIDADSFDTVKLDDAKAEKLALICMDLANAILWLHCHRDEFKDTEFIEVVNGNYPKYQVKIQQAMNDEGGALYLSCWYPLIKSLSVDCMPEHITKDRVMQQAIYVNTYMLVYQAAKSLKDSGAVKELVGHLDTDADKITNLAFVVFCMELDMVNSIA